MTDVAFEEPPAKRRRLSDQSSGTIPAGSHGTGFTVPNNHEIKKEAEVGISAYVNSSSASFYGLLKTRYTDFLVNEILPDGEVLHLKNTKPLRPGVEGKSAEQPGQHKIGAQNRLPAQPQQDDDASNSLTDIPNGHDKDSAQSAISMNKLPEPTAAQIDQLTKYLNPEAAKGILDLVSAIREHPDRKPKDHVTVRTSFTDDRSLRGEIHQFIRSTFDSRLETSTDTEGFLLIAAAPPRINSGNAQSMRKGGRGRGEKSNSRNTHLSWKDRGGEYCHFTLHKENKDTMEVLSFLSRTLHVNAKVFAFAGTKDRRAVTVQRVSVHRVEPERLAGLSRTLRGSELGDYECKPNGLELGELAGNEFLVTLRDCNSVSSEELELDTLKTRIRSLREDGFLNYYGLQRFGTFSMRTDVIGRHILKGDFESACNAILYYAPETLSAAQAEQASEQVEAVGFEQDGIGRDDKARALAIHTWRSTGKIHDALEIMPRRFSAETMIVRHISKHKSDWLGALMSIQRNLRLMYVHAYQSWVWNHAATKRWGLYGGKIVAGDLVLVNEHKDKETVSDTKMDKTTDQDGDVIVEPAPEDRAADVDDIFERARPLSQAEVDSGKYSIFDIVLPQPGYDILYPQNESGKYFKELMESDAGGNLDAYDMKRKQREFSLSGSYRKVVARIGEDWHVSLRDYSDDNEQFVQTDVERLRQADERVLEGTGQSNNNSDQACVENAGTTGKKTAIVLRFQLGSSQYATMALRELSRSGVTSYKPEYNGGR